MGPAFNNNTPALCLKMPSMDHREAAVASPSNERLHLKWKGLASNLAGTLSAEVSELGLSRSDADVLLLGSRGTRLRAHRVVLACVSDFLKTVLLQCPLGEEPVLLLDQMDGETLADLMTYLYRGQVNLTPRRLSSLIAWGKTLAIKGILELEANNYTADPPMAHVFRPAAAAAEMPPITPWSAATSGLVAAGHWHQSAAAPASTGLSLLASAALDSDNVSRERRFSSSNDENNSLNGNGPPTTPISAINLSLKANCESDNSLMIKQMATFKPVLYPKAHLLNIPNPNSLKWKRAMSMSAASTMTSGNMDVDRISDTDEDVLTIDMSATTPQESAPSVGLPATPSPSPSSMGNPNILDPRFQLDVGTNGISYALPLASGVLPATSMANGLLNPNEELLDQSRQNSESNLSQSSSGEGKKWKSRQPKLCVHCDRYFSNQFNLKQHILNMHTVGGDVRCDKCNKTVKNKWYLRRHHVTHHNAPLKK